MEVVKPTMATKPIINSKSSGEHANPYQKKTLKRKLSPMFEEVGDKQKTKKPRVTQKIRSKNKTK